MYLMNKNLADLRIQVNGFAEDVTMLPTEFEKLYLSTVSWWLDLVGPPIDNIISGLTDDHS